MLTFTRFVLERLRCNDKKAYKDFVTQWLDELQEHGFVEFDEQYDVQCAAEVFPEFKTMDYYGETSVVVRWKNYDAYSCKRAVIPLNEIVPEAPENWCWYTPWKLGTTRPGRLWYKGKPTSLWSKTKIDVNAHTIASAPAKGRLCNTYVVWYPPAVVTETPQLPDEVEIRWV